MTADELRLQIALLLRDEYEEAEVRVEGKRIVFEDADDVAVILVTPASRERLLREHLSRRRG